MVPTLWQSMSNCNSFTRSVTSKDVSKYMISKLYCLMSINIKNSHESQENSNIKRLPCVKWCYAGNAWPDGRCDMQPSWIIKDYVVMIFHI